MPTYVFQCTCGARGEENRRIADFISTRPCLDCGGTQKIRIQWPYLTTRPHALREENNPYPGLSETEITAQRKIEDAQYYAPYERGMPKLEEEPMPAQYEGVTPFDIGD